MRVFVLLVLVSALTIGKTGVDSRRIGNKNAQEESSMEVFKEKAPAVSGTALLAVHSRAAAAAADPLWPSEEDTAVLTRAIRFDVFKAMVPVYMVDPAAPTGLPENMEDDLLTKFKEAGGNDEGFQEFLTMLLETAKTTAIRMADKIKEKAFWAMRRYPWTISGRPGEISAEHKAGLQHMFRMTGGDGDGFQKFLKRCEKEFETL